MANPDQKTLLMDNAYEEIKKICINLQKDTDASNLEVKSCLLYTSPSPRDLSTSRMPSSA